MTAPEIVVIGPLIETAFFQLLIGTAARSFTERLFARWMAVAIPFAVIHFFIGVVSGLSAGVVGGLLFGFVFVAWQDVSTKKAFAATLLAHCLHNASALAAHRLFFAGS